MASYHKRMASLPSQPSEYVAEVTRILKSERERAAYYFFDKKFENEYLIKIEEELIDNRLEGVLKQQGGLDSFIEASNERDLTDTYALCKRRAQNTFKYLKERMTNYFYTQGKKIADNYLEQDKKDSTVYVEGIIDLKKKCNLIVEQFFCKDVEFVKLKNQVFKDILRYEGDKDDKKKIDFMGAKNLAQYSDKKIKDCAKLDAENKKEEILNNIILVFESLMAHDVFLIEHQKTLSKRLL